MAQTFLLGIYLHPSFLRPYRVLLQSYRDASKDRVPPGRSLSRLLMDHIPRLAATFTADLPEYFGLVI